MVRCLTLYLHNGVVKMPSQERRLDEAAEKFLQTRIKKKRAEQTIKGYRWIIGKVNRELIAAGYNPYPTRWTEATVNFLLDDVYPTSRSTGTASSRTWTWNGRRTGALMSIG
jgi:hypothetical protein